MSDDEYLTQTINLLDLEDLDSQIQKGGLKPSLVLASGPSDQIGKQWVIGEEGATLGRSNKTDIRIDHVGISRRHARFEFDSNGNLTLKDLGSMNLTAVDGNVLTPNQPIILSDSSTIKAGAFVFKFFLEGVVAETTENARRKEELETAKSIQESLYPAESETVYKSVKIGGLCRSASETCGDWWWHWCSGEKVFVIIADAMGHGASAALATIAARTAVATLEENDQMGIEQVFLTLSSALNKSSSGKMSMSAVIVEIDFAAKVWRYINASHPFPILLPKSESELDWKFLDLIDDRISETLGSNRVEMEVGERPISPETRLVLMTDGLTEQMDPTGYMLGNRQFNNMLIKSHQAHPADQGKFLTSLVKAVDDWSQSATQKDDITVVALDFL